MNRRNEKKKIYSNSIVFKNTEVDHPDYLPLKDAISNFISMANFINEYKRRKEIGKSVCLSVYSVDCPWTRASREREKIILSNECERVARQGKAKDINMYKH